MYNISKIKKNKNTYGIFFFVQRYSIQQKTNPVANRTVRNKNNCFIKNSAITTRFDFSAD